MSEGSTNNYYAIHPLNWILVNRKLKKRVLKNRFSTKNLNLLCLLSKPGITKYFRLGSILRNRTFYKKHSY